MRVCVYMPVWMCVHTCVCVCVYVWVQKGMIREVRCFLYEAFLFLVPVWCF